MATIVTRSGKGSPLTHAEVDSNFTNLNTDKLELSGGTMTGNLSFGDNDKAIFGAGNDLQIYSDGDDSYITESSTTGNLFIEGTNVLLRNTAGEYYMVATSDAGVALRHDNATVFTTTSIGVDITGTLGVTTVDFGDWTITESGGSLYFATGGTNKMKLDASGNLQVVGNVEANATIS